MGKISTAEVLRLRATSSVSGDKSVRRCAQDDDSVGEPEEGPAVSSYPTRHLLPAERGDDGLALASYSE
jgi:hypothetical protein